MFNEFGGIKTSIIRLQRCVNLTTTDGSIAIMFLLIKQEEDDYCVFIRTWMAMLHRKNNGWNHYVPITLHGLWRTCEKTKPLFPATSEEGEAFNKQQVLSPLSLTNKRTIKIWVWVRSVISYSQGHVCFYVAMRGAELLGCLCSCVFYYVCKYRGLPALILCQSPQKNHITAWLVVQKKSPLLRHIIV